MTSQLRTDDVHSTLPGLGIENLLKTLIEQALADSTEIESLALGDAQGLPIADATKGNVPVLTFTAMATMSLRSAKTAAESVGLDPPEYLVVHCPTGLLVIMQLPGSRASLIALLRSQANLGLALVVLRRLAERIAGALGE